MTESAKGRVLVLDRGRGVFTLPRVRFAGRPGGGLGAARECDRDRERSLLLALLHLGALWALAVAQPLFDLIRKNPDFLAARGMRGLEVVLFAVVIALAPPPILVALEAGSGLVVAGLRRWLHLAFVAVLFGLIAIQALKHAEASGAAALIVFAAAIGIAAAILYRRATPVRSFLTVLSRLRFSSSDYSFSSSRSTTWCWRATRALPTSASPARSRS